MDSTKVLEYLLGTSPLAAVMFWLFWVERKERREIAAKVEAVMNQRVTDTQATSDKLMRLAETSRDAIGANTSMMSSFRDALSAPRYPSAPDQTPPFGIVPGGRR